MPGASAKPQAPTGQEKKTNEASRAVRILRGVSHPSFWPVSRYLAAGALARLLNRGGRPASALRECGSNPEPVPLEPVRDTGHLDTIPQIVFQTLKSRVEIPRNYRYWRNTFLAHNPDFQCVLWDDADNRS